MKIFDINTRTCISLLNVTYVQAESLAKLLSVSPHGIRFTAGWTNRKPVIQMITALPMSVDVPVKFNDDRFSIDITSGDAGHFQKKLKAFGNRVADAARKPLKFQRVHAAGRVHFTPSFHHIAACGVHCVDVESKASVNCISCLLAAVTPPSCESKGEYRPFGHILLRDIELIRLRDQAYKSDSKGIRI